MHSSSIDESNRLYKRLHSLILLVQEFMRNNSNDNQSVMTFLDKFKRTTSSYLSANPESTFKARMIIRRHYLYVDNSYIFNIN
jgi:hypothetical protein